MNKNRILLFPIFLIMVFFTGCSFMDTESETVETPTISKTAIEGKWTITKCIFPENVSEKSFEYKDIIGTDVVFSPKGVIIDDLYSDDARYKVKKVNARNYLLRKYNISKKKLSIDSETLTVIYIYDKDEFFYEIIKVNEEEAYIFMKGFFIQITKSGDVVSDEEFNEILEREKNNLKNAKSVENLNNDENGFLLGIKTLDQESEIKKWNYKTLYFKFTGNKIEEIYEIPDIMLPRQNDFASIKVVREIEEGKIQDIIVMTDENGDETENFGVERFNPKENSIKNIIFASPNYLNIENIFQQEKYGDSTIKELELYYIDSLDKRKKVELGDMVDKGNDIFKDEAEHAIKVKDRVYYDPYNLGLQRDGGYWKLFGRMKLKKDESYLNKDFRINILLPNGMMKYDNLTIPYSELKKEISGIKDAFISPNNRFLITLENKRLRVYNIVNGKIDKNYIYETEMDPTAVPVMTEWAIGRYSEIWQHKISHRKQEVI